MLRQHASGPERANGSIITFLPQQAASGTRPWRLRRRSISRRAARRSVKLASSISTFRAAHSRLTWISSHGSTSLKFSVIPSRLDQHLVDVLTSKHSSGVDVFASPPGRFDYSKLDSTVLFALLDEISRRYDVVHLDLPTMWFPWMDNLMLGSDRILVTGTYNIPSVKRLATKMQYLESLNIPADRIAALINHTETGLFGGGVVRRSDITSALPGVQVMFVRRDGKTALEPLNAGRSISQSSGGRGLKKDIKQVGEWIDNAKHERTSAALKRRHNRGAECWGVFRIAGVGAARRSLSS